MASDYLNRWWQVDWRIYASLRPNELKYTLTFNPGKLQNINIKQETRFKSNRAKRLSCVQHRWTSKAGMELWFLETRRRVYSANLISLVMFKTAVSLLLAHWIYCNLAQNYRWIITVWCNRRPVAFLNDTKTSHTLSMVTPIKAAHSYFTKEKMLCCRSLYIWHSPIERNMSVHALGNISCPEEPWIWKSWVFCRFQLSFSSRIHSFLFLFN